MPVLGPLVGMPATHRRDPCTVGHNLAPRGQSLLYFTDRRRVFENRVITGSVPKANNVNVRLDQARHDRSAAQIDHSNTGSRLWGASAYRDKSAISNRHGLHNGIAPVDGMDPSIDEGDRGLIW